MYIVCTKFCTKVYIVQIVGSYGVTMFGRKDKKKKSKAKKQKNIQSAVDTDTIDIAFENVKRSSIAPDDAAIYIVEQTFGNDFSSDATLLNIKSTLACFDTKRDYSEKEKSSLLAKKAELEDLKAKLEQQLGETIHNLDSTNNSIPAIEEEIDLQAKILADLNYMNSKLVEEINFDEEIQNLSSKEEKLSAEIEEFKSKISEVQSAIDADHQGLESMSAEKDKNAEEIKSAVLAITEIQQAGEELINAQKVMENKKDALMTHTNKLTSKVNKLEQNKANLESTNQSLQNIENEKNEKIAQKNSKIEEKQNFRSAEEQQNTSYIRLSSRRDELASVKDELDAIDVQKVEEDQLAEEEAPIESESEEIAVN